MNEFTTIQITKELKDKLNVLKSATGKKYNDIIAELLEQKEGTTTDDIITITREQIALSLKYWEYNKPETAKIRDITFKELKNDPMGNVYVAQDNPNNKNDFVNATATLVYRNGDDVILLVKEISFIGGAYDNISSVVHVNLF